MYDQSVTHDEEVSTAPNLKRPSFALCLQHNYCHIKLGIIFVYYNLMVPSRKLYFNISQYFNYIFKYQLNITYLLNCFFFIYCYI